MNYSGGGSSPKRSQPPPRANQLLKKERRAARFFYVAVSDHHEHVRRHRRVQIALFVVRQQVIDTYTSCRGRKYCCTGNSGRTLRRRWRAARRQHRPGSCAEVGLLKGAGREGVGGLEQNVRSLIAVARRGVVLRAQAGPNTPRRSATAGSQALGRFATGAKRTALYTATSPRRRTATRPSPRLPGRATHAC